MLIAQYAGVGEFSPVWDFTVTDGGELSFAGILYFACCLQNRSGGFSRPAISDAVSFVPGKKITINIPASVQRPGWDIHTFILSAGTTPDPATMVQIARVSGFQSGAGIESQSLRTILPTQIVLSCDTHIALAPNVASVQLLPDGEELLDGQIRWVISEAKFFEYRADSDAGPSPDILLASQGRWHRVGNASAYVASTTGAMGSDRPLESLSSAVVILPPKYPAGTSQFEKVLPGWESIYWLRNTSNEALPPGQEIVLNISFNDQESPNLLDGKLKWKFLGFVNTNSGNIRSADSQGRSFSNINAYFDWKSKGTPFVTEDYLQPGEAIALAVKPFFCRAELPRGRIGIVPGIKPQSGDFNSLGNLVPRGLVYPVGERYRALPGAGLSVIVGSGSALVASYDFPLKSQRFVGGWQPNLSGQKLIINGNGDLFVESPNYQPTASEAIRAVIGTTGGESAPSLWSDWCNLSNSSGLSVNITHPCNAAGKGTVRGDYPDAIASSVGDFNPLRLVLYIEKQGGEIRKFTGFSCVAQPSQIIQISAWGSGSVAAGVAPIIPAFSLYAPTNCAVSPSTQGDFAAGQYRGRIAYEYDGLQVTSVSHASPPCIEEMPANFNNLFDSYCSWGASVFDIAALRNISLSDVWAWQARRAGTRKYYYHPEDLGADDGDTCIRPAGKSAQEPGRWRQEEGTTILTVQSTPAPTLGVYGAIAVDAITGNVWRKVSSTAWRLEGNIRGPQGETGSPPYLYIGDVTVRNPGQPPTASVVSAPDMGEGAYRINFGIPIGISGSPGPPGRGMAFRGNWTEGAYSPGDIVRDAQGNLWLATDYVASAIPYWQLLCTRSDGAGQAMEFLPAAFGRSFQFVLMPGEGYGGIGTVQMHKWQEAPNSFGNSGSWAANFQMGGTINFTPNATFKWLTFKQRNIANVQNGQPFWDTIFFKIMGSTIFAIGF